MYEQPQPQRCAMDGCTKHLERRGGRFIYSKEKNALFCEDCFLGISGNNTVFNSAKNLWEFTTTHFTGEKIHVRSLQHLRELEKKYGASNHAANYMEGQWGTPPSVREAPYLPTERMSHGSFNPEERR